MPTAYIGTKENSDKNKSYYLNLAASEITDCLNANGISYNSINNFNSLNVQEIDKLNTAKIILAMNEKPDDYENPGIYITFIAGNSESNRLANIISKNLSNIYSNVKTSAQNAPENVMWQNIASVTIDFKNSENETNNILLMENTEEIAKNIVMSLSEYFGLPFTACAKNKTGITNTDVNVFKRPSTDSDIKGNIEANTKVKILGMWEMWYIVGQNGNIGYVQSKFINV